MATRVGLGLKRFPGPLAAGSSCAVGKRHLSQNWCARRHNGGEEVIRVSFSAVICQACPVKELCTKREKKGRIPPLSPQSIHEPRYALWAGIEGTISEGIHRHGMRRAA